ncbi:A24 family peptidase [Sulfurimonas sp.]|uniref:prepilin peptidase n=1 Tax=Sulfurimonas sp. TaxID=2022749 RepID=UPI00356AC612
MIELILIFIFGIVFGSFLNVVILRVPNNESVIFNASHCYSCDNKLKPWHNIPLFSWIFLGGKCAYCQSKISKQYPIIELVSGLLFVALAQKLTISIPTIFIYLSFTMLLALSMIDFKYKMVPDSLNLLAILFAIIGVWSISSLIENFTNALLVAGGFTLLRFALSYILTSLARIEADKTLTPWTKYYQRYPYIEAMGEGDIMVAATMGALLGVELALVAIFLSAILTLPIMVMVHNKSAEEQRVPFVPFLALATFIVYIYDSPIMRYIEANY